MSGNAGEAQSIDPKTRKWLQAPPTYIAIHSLGVYLVVQLLVLAFLVVVLWPPEGADPLTLSWPFGTQQSLRSFSLSYEGRMVLFVLVLGAFGASLAAGQEFVTLVKRAELTRAWIWHYIYRAFSGSAVALLTYLVIRGGLLSISVAGSDSTSATALNPFGIAAIAGLSGLFEKEATAKLREVMTTLFATK